MINTIINNSLRYVLLVLLQVLILNNVHFHQLFNPFLYVLFILMLPFETPKWLLLLLGAMIGLTIDVFTNTLGMHMSASIFVAFCRPIVLNLIAPREGYEFGMRPHIQLMGLQWIIIYSSILVLAHHLWLYTVEAFRFSAMPTVLLKTLISGSFTLILIVIAQYLTFKSKEKE